LGSRRAPRAALFALALGLALLAPLARADEPDASTRMAARELALSGAEAFDRQDYATALDRFQRAESLFKVPSIAVMVARCLARTGRVVESVDKYEETLRMPLDAAAPEAFQRAVADATAEVEAVRARVPRLELHMPADAPPEARVLLDDKAVPAALLGVPIPLNPGPHHLTAHSPGRQRYHHDLVLAEGTRQSVEIALLPLEPARASQNAASVPKADAEPPSPRPSMLAVSLLAGGGVALAVGTVSGIAALGHKSKLDTECSPGCPPDMSKELDAYRFDRTLSYVGFGLGLAAAGAGTYFLLQKSPSGSQVGAQLFPGGAALKGRF
jgi:hypothetical protein